MASDAPTAQVSDLDWLMSGLVQRVPHTTSAVLLSCDGLVKSVHGLDPDAADHMAALASGLYSLGRSAGVRFGGASSRVAFVRHCDDASRMTKSRRASVRWRTRLPCCNGKSRLCNDSSASIRSPVSPIDVTRWICCPPSGSAAFASSEHSRS